MDNKVNTSNDTTIMELQEIVNNLPRTDHMTLPAVQITKIDEETKTRSEDIVKINESRDMSEVASV